MSSTSEPNYFPSLPGGDWFAVIESFTACLRSAEQPIEVQEAIVDGMLIVRAAVGELDPERLEVRYADGVLEIRIPVQAPERDADETD